MVFPYRARQAFALMRSRGESAPQIPPDAQALLTEPMAHQFRILSVADQCHLLDVFRRLQEMDAQSDTLIAGLLHDVGKGCMKCNISVVDRTAHVLLSRALPSPYRRFASRETVPPSMMGLHRLANHAERGALAARQAGYNERVCWLIRHHESGGDPLDAELQLLRAADDAAGTAFRQGGSA